MIQPEPGADDRQNRIQQLIERVLQDRELQGQSDNFLIQQHADLMPELAEQLRRLRMLQGARKQTDEPSEHGGQSVRGTADWGLRVRCPACGQPIEVVSQTSLNAICCSSCGSSFNLIADDVVSKSSVPRKVLGHFEIIERLGMGAFGSVWKARDTELDRLVAVKIPRFADIDPFEMEKFVREARSAAQLQHPQIVTVHEIGRDEDTLYVVSELIDGVPLSEWSRSRKPTHGEAASLCRTIAHAVHHAHEAGVIHRDLKPANILIDATGAPHITDFGLAKRESGEITLTVDGEVLGTPAYLSPEQARGESHSCDRRSDVYSLGAILFELLTGELPFRGTVRMLLLQVIHDEAPRLRRLNSTIPRDLETICLKCLEKNPDRRYQSAAELADDLGRWLEHRPIQAKPASSLAKLQKWSHRNPRIAGAICLTASICFAGLIYWQTRPAYLDVRVIPNNAAASLNGKHVHLSDGRALLATTPGVSQLTVSAPGYVADNRQITLSRGRSNALPMTIALEARFGYVVVDSSPRGGRVTLTNSEGKVAGEGATPYHSRRLPAGTYKVTLSKELYQNASLNVSVPLGERVTQPETIKLAPAIKGTQGSWLLSEYRKAMDREVDVDFRGKTLEQATAELSKQIGLQISFNSSVSVLLRGTILYFYGRGPLRAIRDHLSTYGLTLIPVAENDSQFALNLVTQDEARMRIAHVLHPIADLIDADSYLNANMISGAIINLAPDTWSSSGSWGTIAFLQNANALDVHQIWDIQYAIDEHLAELRRWKVEIGRNDTIAQGAGNRSPKIAVPKTAAIKRSDVPQFQSVLSTRNRLESGRNVAGTLRARVLMANAADSSQLRQMADAVVSAADRLVTAEHKEMLSEAALNIGFRSLSLGQFDHSEKLAEVAFRAADEIHRPDLINQARFLQDEIPRIKHMCETLDGFHVDFFYGPRQFLEPRQSSSFARFLSFVEGDWGNGLKMLVQVGDSELRSVAELELKQPADPIAQLAIAEAWWKLSESLSDSYFVGSYRQRAKYWYLKALASTESMARAKLAERVLPIIDSLPQQPMTLRIRARGVEGKQTIRISNDGISLVSSHGTQSVQINHLLSESLPPSLTVEHPNIIGARVFPHAIDFTTADVRSVLRGQESQVAYDVGPDHFHVEFERAPGGSGDFEIAVMLEANGYSLANRVSGPWDVQWFVWNPGTDSTSPPKWDLADRVKLDRLDFQSERHPQLTKRYPPSESLRTMDNLGGHFSMNASSEWKLPAGKYEIHTMYDDGIRVTVNGKQIIDDWNTHRGETCLRSKTAEMQLDDGLHKLTVEFFEESGNGRLKFSLRRLANELDAAYQRPNYALSFDGNREIRVWNGFTAPDPLTLEAWVTPQDVRLGESGSQTIVGDLAPKGVNLALASVEGRPYWRFNVHQGDNCQWVNSDEPAVARKEVHLAGVCENGEVRLYVDGKLQTGRARVEGKVEATAYPLMFRAQPEWLVLFRGTIDEVRFSRTARYRDDIPPARRLTSDEKTVFLFSFDEGIGDFIADSAANRFMGVVKGARWIHR